MHQCSVGVQHRHLLDTFSIWSVSDLDAFVWACLFYFNDTWWKWLPVEDVSDLWPTVKPAFEARLPFKRASLNNKTRNPVLVGKLPAEFILTTDSRLRSRFPQEQLLFWFREPYATVVLVTCEVMCIIVDYFFWILAESFNVLMTSEIRLGRSTMTFDTVYSFLLQCNSFW